MPDVSRSAADPGTPTRASAGRWIALETAGLYGSIAAGRVSGSGCDLVETLSLPTDARSARTLAPALDALLNRLDWPPASLSVIAVAVGPGSFTGLRVGIVTAKTFAYATGTAILGVDTLDALAATAAPPGEEGGTGLWTVLDAQRQELFAAYFLADGSAWLRAEATQRVSRADLASRLEPTDRVLGPVAETLGLGDQGSTAAPTAAGVLRVAHQRWLAGATDNAFALAPQYHRQSAAEEKLAGGNAP